MRPGGYIEPPELVIDAGARIVQLAAGDAEVFEHHLELADVNCVLLNQLNVEPRCRIVRHASLSIEVATRIGELLLG